MFHLQGTKYTPEILFDPSVALMKINGVSTPDNALEFYKQIFTLLQEYVASGGRSIEASFYLDYFNTSSAKCIFDIFKWLERIQKSGKNVTVNWIYDEGDEDMLEAGEDYQELIPLAFSFTHV